MQLFLQNTSRQMPSAPSIPLLSAEKMGRWAFLIPVPCSLLLRQRLIDCRSQHLQPGRQIGSQVNAQGAAAT